MFLPRRLLGRPLLFQEGDVLLQLPDLVLRSGDRRAFREAQRSMLDQLSIGVAQFDAGHRMTFANQPFHRVFSLPPGVVNERTSFGSLAIPERVKVPW